MSHNRMSSHPLPMTNEQSPILGTSQPSMNNNDSMGEVSQASSCYCSTDYLHEYTCTPWITMIDTYENELGCHGRDNASENVNGFEITSTLATIPVVLPVTAICSVFGFFAGAARDTYTSMTNCCPNTETDQPVRVIAI